jgi:hypothetical protein
MKMKSVFITLITFLSFISLKAQPRELDYSKISDHIFHNYRPDSAALATFCRIGCIFIKFKIDPRGEVANLSFSGDVDSTTFITDGLTRAVNSLKQDTELINNLRKSGRTIVQPFIYNYQAGCNFPKAASPGNGGVDNTNFYLSYMTFAGEMDHISKSLFNILNFKDGDKLFLDNILLSPIGVGSGSMQ